MSFLAVCRRRGSNPHSRREHDFESCASASSATPAESSRRTVRLPGALVYNATSRAQRRIARLWRPLCQAGKNRAVDTTAPTNKSGRPPGSAFSIATPRMDLAALAPDRNRAHSTAAKSGLPLRAVPSDSSRVVNLTLTILLTPCSSMVTP